MNHHVRTEMGQSLEKKASKEKRKKPRGTKQERNTREDKGRQIKNSCMSSFYENKTKMRMKTNLTRIYHVKLTRYTC